MNVKEELERMRPTVEALARILHEKDVRVVEVGNGELRVKLTRKGAALPLPAPVVTSTALPEPTEEGVAEANEPAIVPVTSDRVGRFLPAADMGRGVRVEAGDILCYIESMRLMNEVRAPLAGTILEILVEEGHPVEYGQALVALSPVV